MVTVYITPEAQQQLNGLPKAMQPRARNLVKRLGDWPVVSGLKALSGDLAGWYRLRFGDYRMRFRVQGETVTVDKIGHRKEIYED